MKIKLIAILLVLTLISQTAQFALATEISGDPVNISDTATGEGTESEQPLPGLEWMSYSNFRQQETYTAWNTPEVYVGCTAVFNFESWQSFALSDGFDGDVKTNYVGFDDLKDDSGESIKVVITDYYFDTAANQLWYKVGGVDGAEFPTVLSETPYVLHLEVYEKSIQAPSLIMSPVKGEFVGETVTIQKDSAAASAGVEVDSALLPDFIDITPKSCIVDEFGGKWYDVYGVDGIDPEYRYVSESAIMLIPAEVTAAYELLLEADGSAEYYEILAEIPEEITAKFTDKHTASLDEFVNRLIAAENVVHQTTASFNGTPIAVSVKGKIPETGVTLQAEAVTNERVMAEGFDVKDPANIIVALDIKLINDEDGTEWQPAEGERITVSIDVASLGYEDGTIFRLHHKHGDEIYTFDVFIVIDGKLTVTTNGFSIYMVDKVGDNQQGATEITNGSTIEMTIGETRYYYYRRNDGNRQPTIGTWEVTDTEGAVYYIVYANTDDPRNDGVLASWIKITALKETTKGVSLRFVGDRNTDESYTLNIVPPKATGGKDYTLYLKDDVNTSGCIVAALSDKNGNDVSGMLDGAAYSWSRDDDYIIVPAAYEQEYKAVNIARDHGGLVEARKDDDGKYKPTTYTLKVTLSNGDELEASYTVYYQSEIINSSFESPDATRSNYTFFPNGWDELYWKTTAPGSINGEYSKDIEYGDVTGKTDNNTGFGVKYAADWDHQKNTGGVQFAEVNAEAFGALYQDIISAPHEYIDWEFEHAPRPKQTWANDVQNGLFIVIGATEQAQKIDNNDLNKLCQAAMEGGYPPQGGEGKEVTYSGAVYRVWYHNAGQVNQNADGNGISGSYNSGNYGWTTLSGEYEVLDNQYRTRIFFVSDTVNLNSNHPNAGNLIDSSRAGQYKEYLIEYYAETIDDDGKIQKEYLDSYDETGEAIIYSSVEIQNLIDSYISKNYYLHEVYINGEKNPYDIRYSGKPVLYIETYPKGEYNKELAEKAHDSEAVAEEKYKDYDIIMQIVVRDTVIAVQKKLEFPTELTDEQKLTIIENLAKEKGYQAEFDLLVPSDPDFTSEPDTISIKQRNPDGSYTGYVSLGDAPPAGKRYQVEETKTTEILGLELDEVTINVVTYKYGETHKEELEKYDSTISDVSTQRLLSKEFDLTNEARIADVTVTNTYREKETTIYYEAVGNGKVAVFDDENDTFLDTPTEVIKFYSEQADGAKVTVGEGASFIGWYLDEACTIPVQAKDGVVDNDGSFRPNVNVIEDYEVTFYAKFASSSIVIERENAEPNQTFVYKITDSKNNTMYVTLTCDADGKGKREIMEMAPKEKYTVTEISDWTWRYDGDSQTVIANDPTEEVAGVKFISDYSDYWLNGYSAPVKNVYNGS